MDTQQFWQLIEKTQVENDWQGQRQAELIIQALLQMPLEEIISYEHLFGVFDDRAERYDLRDVTEFIIACGDSDWKDFRGWLIGQGQKTYEMVLADPDALSEIISVEKRFEIGAELLLYTGQQAYSQRMGDENLFIPDIVDEFYQPPDRGESLGKPFTTWEDYYRRFAEKFPKTWAKFYDEVDHSI